MGSPSAWFLLAALAAPACAAQRKVGVGGGEAAATNELAIEVGVERVAFLVNGAEVATVERSDVNVRGISG